MLLWGCLKKAAPCMAQAIFVGFPKIQERQHQFLVLPYNKRTGLVQIMLLSLITGSIPSETTSLKVQLKEPNTQLIE